VSAAPHLRSEWNGNRSATVGRTGSHSGTMRTYGAPTKDSPN